MKTNNEQKYIDTLIDNINKYDYYTIDQSSILSLQKLKNVKKKSYYPLMFNEKIKIFNTI